jgi:hypothetical protein
MRQFLTTFAAVYVLVLGAASCNSNSSSGPAPVPPTAQFTQIERLARPAVKELFQAFANHDGTNRTSPAAQPLSGQTLYQEIGSFTTSVAGRDAAHAATLQAVLIPDEVSADLSKTGTGSYLGVETGGATAADKDTFGGRTLADDVIDISLGAVFGNTLSALGLIPDDGKEVPCLTTDNVPQQNAADNVTTTFPYVGTPH